MALAENGEVTTESVGAGPDRYLVINPFFHSFGYKAGIVACLVTGATIVPQSVFDVGRAMELVSAERITVLPGPPTIYQTILDHPARDSFDLSTLRFAVTGAAVVPVALEGFFEAWPRGEKFCGLSKLKVRFLDPVYPPALGPNPEAQYAEMTAEIRSRIVAAYDELRAR